MPAVLYLKCTSNPNQFLFFNSQKQLPDPTYSKPISLRKMDNTEIVDKHGNTIHEGDYVFTRIRGGSHEGKVWQTCLVTTELLPKQFKA